MLAALYRKVIPSDIRAFIYRVFLGDLLAVIRNPKLWIKYRWYGFYYSIVTPKTEKEQAYKAWSRTGSCSTPYPYLWKEEYDQLLIDVHIDVENYLPFVIHHGKRLYFGRDMINDIPGIYKGLLIEQDERSAHRYVVSYSELTDKVLLDIGAAEAIFALDTIEYVNHAYLFECDERWLEALKATFAPWKEKVTIVRKYVSDINDENNVTLDSYFSDKQTDNLFLKMDIEGYERNALKSAKNLLEKAKNISGSVCIYHLHDDKDIIQKLLKRLDYVTEIQPGYILFEQELRSAILRFHPSLENASTRKS